MNFTTPLFRWKYSLLAFMIVASISCNPIKPLEYQGLSHWDIQIASIKESTLSATVSLFNPNPGKITVKKIDASILVNGSQWGHYYSENSFIIPGNDTFRMPLELNVSNSKLVSGALKIAKGENLSYDLKGIIKGSYKGISAEVPFEQTGKFSEKDLQF